MAKQDHRFGAKHGRRSRSRKLRPSARHNSRAPLFFESLEPRNLLANGWLANAAPLSLDSPDAPSSSISFEQGAIAQDDTIGSGHMLMMSTDMHGSTAAGIHEMGGTPTLTGAAIPDGGADSQEAVGDHHDCCRPLPAVSVKSGTPTLTGAAISAGGGDSQEAVGDHHDCCRPLPAVSVKSGTPALAGAAISDGGGESQDAVGDHHDCCRPLPAAPELTVSQVATRTMAVSGDAHGDDTHGDHHDCCRPVPTTLITSPTPAATIIADDSHGDHHDCCRPLPAVSVTAQMPAVTAETAPSAAATISAETVAPLGPAISGDGESSQGQPAFSPVPPNDSAPAFSQPPVVPLLGDARPNGSRSGWGAPTASGISWDDYGTRWMNGTNVPSIRSQTKQANDKTAADDAYVAAVDSLMLERSDLWDGLKTAEGEGELVPNFALLDLNPASATYQQTVSPRDYLGAVSVWFFGYST